MHEYCIFKTVRKTMPQYIFLLKAVDWDNLLSLHGSFYLSTLSHLDRDFSAVCW